MIRRIVLVKPCCIGDVIMATALLTALRRGYPDAEIDWVVGSMAIAALRGHPDLHQVIDSGPLANPASKPGSMLRLVRLLRAGRYDLAVVPERSPLTGIATVLARIPQRAGLDSAGRGFSYTIKAPIDPAMVRHEAEIYLDVARALGLSTDNCWVNVPPSPQSLQAAQAILTEAKGKPLIVVHPGGGVNAGMTMTEKRWPADRFAALADRVADVLGGAIAVIGVESDRPAVERFCQCLQHPLIDLTNRLPLSVIGALASLSALYIGNDNGVAHLAAASGGKVVMIFGPSDPRRYAPFVPADRACFVWRSVPLPDRGVNAGIPTDFNWERDGASVDEAWVEAQKLIGVSSAFHRIPL
ncbi:MAG: glycosyltransferase family 9 protein [Anaerolineae bacterium]|nr:glycosyltransferase family 9 protein [Anaerolineae bacterium]